MNKLINTTTTKQRMSSVEIAELTGKRHDNVVRDVTQTLKKVGISSSSFLRGLKSASGQKMKVYDLPKRECLLVVAKYSDTLRLKIIDRWMELEAAAAPTVPQTMAQALRLAADQAEQIEALERQKQLDAPKVAFAEVINGTSGLMSVGAFAQLSGNIGRNNLFKKLREMKILRENNAPYQTYIDRGYFETRETVISRTAGDIIKIMPLITGKGQLWLAEKIGLRSGG